MNDERKGHPSASSFFRYIKCPGAFQLEMQAREIGQLAFQGNKYAERGTRIHAWLALTDEERELVTNLLKLPEKERKSALAKLNCGIDPDILNLTDADLQCGNDLKARADEQVRLLFPDSNYLELKEKRAWLRN